jgi:hypothetical protein
MQEEFAGLRDLTVQGNLASVDQEWVLPIGYCPHRKYRGTVGYSHLGRDIASCLSGAHGARR